MAPMLELKEKMISGTDTHHIVPPAKVDPMSGIERRKSSVGGPWDPDLDRGWSWVVLAATFVSSLIASGHLYNSGIFFVVFLEEFQESRTMTSWILVSQSLVLCTSGPISSMILSLIGPRFTTMIGAFIMSVSFGVVYFANSVWVLIAIFGISGFGASMMVVANMACIAIYFKKKLYLAAAINNSAVGVGIMIFGVELEWAIESFGWRLSMIIQSAILMQIVVCAALVFNKLDPSRRRRRPSLKIHVAPPGDTDHQHEQVPLSPPPTESAEGDKNQTGNNKMAQNQPVTIRESLKYFADTRFCLILISLFLLYGCAMIVFGVIKDVTKLNGTENYDVIIASMGICNAIGRVLCGLQVIFVNPPTMYMISSAVSAVATAGLIYADTEVWSIVCASLIGFFQGQQVCLQGLTLAYLFSRNMMATLFGYGLVAGGLSSAVFGPLSGYLVDSSGNYISALTLTSVGLFFSGVFVMASYQIHRKRFKTAKIAADADALQAINSYVKVIDS